jgi:hypothetical protein
MTGQPESMTGQFIPPFPRRSRLISLIRQRAPSSGRFLAI